MSEQSIEPKEHHRPKEGLETLPDNWQIEVIKLYKEGGSDEEVKAWIYLKRGKFSNTLWDRWLKEEPSFSETIKGGKLLCKAWWYKQGRMGIVESNGVKINYQGYYMNMKNRFGWCEKTEENINQKVTYPEVLDRLSKQSEGE